MIMITLRGWSCPRGCSCLAAGAAEDPVAGHPELGLCALAGVGVAELVAGQLLPRDAALPGPRAEETEPLLGVVADAGTADGGAGRLLLREALGPTPAGRLDAEPLEGLAANERGRDIAGICTLLQAAV